MANEDLFGIALAELGKLSGRIERIPIVEPPPNRLSAFGLTYHARRLRDAAFSVPGLFGEAAWDILLDLGCADEDGRVRTIADLCRASCVEPTAAIRYVQEMERIGLLDRIDGGFCLSAEGRRRLHAYAQRLAALLPSPRQEL